MRRSLPLPPAVGIIIIIWCLASASVSGAAGGGGSGSGAGGSIVFLPLDERFTTYQAFLSLAQLTPYTIRSPPVSLLPSLKRAAPLASLHQWVEQQLPTADALIISMEMYLYGGLIASRTSNDTQADVIGRLNKLIAYKTQYPRLAIYLSSVVMRIPAYNGDFEEPWYWAPYGYDLYQYSYFQDKFRTTHDPADQAQADHFRSLVRPAIVTEFEWRRSRNFNVTVEMLNAQLKKTFSYVYITQDDNAEYGFNIAEANALRQLVQQKSIAPVAIYPGADEVQLAVLSHYCVDARGLAAPTIELVFRDPTTVNYIPNYEGQAMLLTLTEQVKAAGGVVLATPLEHRPKSAGADIVLLVNNFSEKKQVEAPNQPSSGSLDTWANFTTYLNTQRVIGFVDNRYSNGADNWFVNWIVYQHTHGIYPIDISQWAYAGWNTDGNTLGTVIANALLLHMFRGVSPTTATANAHFNTLRILEDRYWQAMFRQQVSAYADSVGASGSGSRSGESSSHLASDLSFYRRMTFKIFDSYYTQLCSDLNVKLTLTDVFYPWNRTFEIGIAAA